MTKILNRSALAALLTMILSVSSALAAQPPQTPVTAEGQGGNGGGGIRRNGISMTFYSAGFLVEANEATSDEVPQLDSLIHFFNTTELVSAMTKVKYASNLVPSSSRRYYRVKPDTFTPEVRARLIAEFVRVMNINTNDIAIFAITDTQSKTTYLLPEFFALTAFEQKAMLFHEAYWLVNPTVSYKQVIQAEMAFQAYIEAPQSAERLLRWLKTSGTTGDALLAAINIDLKSGAMKGLISRDNQISLQNILGREFFECKQRGIAEECVAFISTHVYQLQRAYPQSLFVKLFADYSANNGVFLVDGTYDKSYNILTSTRITNSESKTDVWSLLSQMTIDLNSIGYSGSSVFAIKSSKSLSLQKYESAEFSNNKYYRIELSRFVRRKYYEMKTPVLWLTK